MSMFSPLALTQALPFLPLAQGDIDYQVDRRNDPDLFSSVLSSPVCTVMLVDGGKVAVPKGQGDLVDYDNVKLRLATLPGAYVLPELASHPQAVPIFLGSYGGARAEQVVAVDVTRLMTTTSTTVCRIPHTRVPTTHSALRPGMPLHASRAQFRRRSNRRRNASIGSICEDSRRMPPHVRQDRPPRQPR